MKVERTVLDTNILISAMLTPVTPFRVLDWVLENGVLIFSDETFRELADRIGKRKFDRYVSQSRRLEMLADFRAVAEWTSINGALHACRDPDDDKFLETALSANADCIVTGDADLLTLNPFENIRVVTASDFISHAIKP
jgi:putative PIN family toxin of toxin-antitoxin system